MGYYETYQSKYMFYAKKNSNQFGIVFDMDAEIHLICRK
jgi:hypothetical protein